jgi:hypothetical protein
VEHAFANGVRVRAREASESGLLGYRIVELEFESPPSAEEEAFLHQVVALTEFHGVGAISTPPKVYPGLWELVFDCQWPSG